MRYLLDTNIVVYFTTDPDLLSDDVFDLINESDAVLCTSAETICELVVAYNNKGLGTKVWKSAEDMVKSIEEDFYIP